MGDVVDERQGPEGPIRVTVFGRTDVGLVREHNEDNFLVADLAQQSRSLLPSVRQHEVGSKGSLLAVCDGMGGAAAGEVASQIAVDTLYELMQDDKTPGGVEELAAKLEDAVLDAGRRIYESARADRTRRGMGTTITAAALVSERIVFAQVGDSRAYLVRKGEMVQVTRDQSLVNQLIEAGQLKPEEAELFEHSNIILQALGTAEDVTVDLTYADLRRGDVLVMCSDGLSGLVSDEQICRLASEDREPIDTCRALTEAAREGGGHDNITVIVAIFDGKGLPSPDANDLVEFQRLSLPGRPSYADRQQSAAGSWGHARQSPRFADKQFGGVREASPADETSGIDEGVANSNPAMLALVVLAVLAIGVGFGYVFVTGHVENEAQGIGYPTRDEAILEPAIACHFVPNAPGTRLVVDGQDYGDLPIDGRWIDLPPGLHSVEARRDNEVMSQQSLRLRPGQRRVEVPLMVATAEVLDLDPGAADADLAEFDGEPEPDATAERAIVRPLRAVERDAGPDKQVAKRRPRKATKTVRRPPAGRPTGGGADGGPAYRRPSPRRMADADQGARTKAPQQPLSSKRPRRTGGPGSVSPPPRPPSSAPPRSAPRAAPPRTGPPPTPNPPAKGRPSAPPVENNPF